MELKTIYYEVITETKFSNHNHNSSYFFNNIEHAKQCYYQREEVYKNMNAVDKCNTRVTLYKCNIATNSCIMLACVGWNAIESNSIAFYESFS